MNLFNFIVWLSAGAVIGWFASRMVQIENRRRSSQKPKPAGEDRSSGKS